MKLLFEYFPPKSLSLKQDYDSNMILISAQYLRLVGLIKVASFFKIVTALLSLLYGIISSLLILPHSFKSVAYKVSAHIQMTPEFY